MGRQYDISYQLSITIKIYENQEYLPILHGSQAPVQEGPGL